MRANDLPLATFLTSPPLSGSIKEEHFGEAGGEGVWIKFEPREGHEAWVGDFRGDGIVPRSGPCVFADGGRACHRARTDWGGVPAAPDEWWPFKLTFEGWHYEGPTYASWMARRA